MHIDHVQLAMPEGGEAEARRFFHDVLGMEEIPKPPALAAAGGCWFRAGDCVIHLGVDPEFRPQRKAHPCIALPELHRLATRLREAGSPVDWDVRIPGVERFFSADPFGNRLEFQGEDDAGGSAA
jgi:catechol 2,3-dioxygenase-like lactoylglutathione lyase family enzyme